MTNTPEQFGAIANDGIDDTQAFIDLFEAGGTIHIPAGQWDFSSSVIVTMMHSLDVTADADAEFVSNGIDGDLFRFNVTASSPNDLYFNWQGGTFNIIDQKNSLVIPYVLQGAPVAKPGGTKNTADALSIRGIYENSADDTSTVKIENVSISDISVIASNEGENWETAGGDSGIFLQAGSATIKDSYFRGLRDDAIYLSADGLLNEVGGNYTVDNVTIEGSVKGIAVQRGADNITIINSTISDTEIGIVVDGTDSGQSKNVVSTNITIENNHISGAWLGIRLSDADDVYIANNTISDLVPFQYIPQIAPSDLYFWDGTEVTNVTYTGNVVSPGIFYRNVLVGDAVGGVIIGTINDDMLMGLAGADTLTGGAGADTLEGGSGIDTASYASSAGAVTVSLHSGIGFNNDAQGDTLTGIENLVGSDFGDTLSGDNSSTIGNDLDGGAGDDWIRGNGGADTLTGGAGADTLEGGSGHDLMMGDDGNDVFVFVDLHGDDTIDGFESSNDLEDIDLSGVAALTSFSQMEASNAIQQVGVDVLINTATGTITLTNTVLSDLHQDDFMF